MKPSRKQRTAPKVDVDGPAVITSLHRWNRPATDDEGRPITGKVACSKWTVLDAAYENGKLGEKGSSQANARFNAGLTYQHIWDAGQGSTTDSTQGLNISRSTVSGGGDGNAAAARHDLEVIHSLLSSRDRIIIRMVCGLGHFPSEAVAMVSQEYTKSTWPRFREALDALTEALDRFRK